MFSPASQGGGAVLLLPRELNTALDLTVRMNTLDIPPGSGHLCFMGLKRKRQLDGISGGRFPLQCRGVYTGRNKYPQQAVFVAQETFGGLIVEKHCFGLPGSDVSRQGNGRIRGCMDLKEEPQAFIVYGYLQGRALGTVGQTVRRLKEPIL